MARKLFAACFVAVFALWSDAACADAAADKFIDSEIDRLVALYSDGIAVGLPEYRHVRMAKNLLDEGEAAVALFSVEGFHGGNLHEEYLAVFEPVEIDEFADKKANPYRLLAVQKIGGRSWRTFDWDTVQIARGSIVVKGKQWTAKDARCCPSSPIRVTFRLRDDALIEVRK